MKALRTTVTVTTLVILGLSCGAPAPEIDPVYRAEIEAAWAEREAALTAEDGWLTLTGLYWLEPGPNIVGSAENAAVRLPDGPPLVGSLHLGDDGTVTLLPDPEAGLSVNAAPASEQTLATDAAGEPDVLRSGRVVFYLIERGSRIGVRVKDPEAKTRTGFAGLDRYPIDPAYRVTARFEAYPQPREVAIPTVIGEPTSILAPGLLRFDIAGTAASLEPFVSSPDDRELFIVFRDATAGDTTYGAGRFLSARLREGSDEVILDFNLATNPPCAFTPFATCPLPTPANTLEVPIKAGERYRGTSH